MLTYCSINTPTFQITHATHDTMLDTYLSDSDILFIDSSMENIVFTGW